MDEKLIGQLREAAGSPPDEAVVESRRRVKDWFAEAAPTLWWDVIESPLGALYVASGEKGLRCLIFGVSKEEFFSELDPLAQMVRDPHRMAAITEQLRAYFDEAFSYFDLPVDLSSMTPFQQNALRVARNIPAGTVWTYKQIAEAVGKPNASRAVGQAMARNPVPIIVPCHRVVGSSGSLTGYGGTGGITTKRWLLQLEGAL